ncbi:MAG: enoyl-CoA hydratase [Rhodospirillales bacterium]|nr:enoyl-CoA hydratase [Rhodospirillales bacterium]
MTEPILLVTTERGVATLTLNRPQARNAMSVALMTAMETALAAAVADPAVRVVVIGANGPAFSAGHDLKELRGGNDPAALEALFAQCTRLMTGIVRLPKPVIAKVQGMATAAGCQLVASCDLAIAARSARFATPGVNIGLFCSTPMVALSRAVAPKHALEMLLTGEAIDAERAQAIGLINQAVADADLERAAADLAATIAGKSARTLRIGKEAFQRQREMDLDAAYAFAGQVMAENLKAADAALGIDAFLAKRKPVWTDR